MDIRCIDALGIEVLSSWTFVSDQQIMSNAICSLLNVLHFLQPLPRMEIASQRHLDR